MKVILAHRRDETISFAINERTYNNVYKKDTAKPDGDADPATAKFVLKKNTPPQAVKSTTKPI